MQTKLNKYLKIGIALVLSFVVTGIVKTEVFVADAPEIRPYLGEYIVWRLKDTGYRAKELAFFWRKDKPEDNQTIAERLKKNLKPIGKGVRAAEDDGVSYTQITIDEVVYIETSYTLPDGRVLKVKSPKGFEPPPMDVIEELNQ